MRFLDGISSIKVGCPAVLLGTGGGEIYFKNMDFADPDHPEAGWAGIGAGDPFVLAEAIPSSGYDFGLSPTGPGEVSLAVGTGGACHEYISAPVLSATPGPTSITLDWTESIPNDVANPIDHYHLSRTGFGVDIDADTFSYEDTAVTAGVTYTYEVLAVPAIYGNRFSNLASATIDGGDVTPPARGVSLDGMKIPLGP